MEVFCAFLVLGCAFLLSFLGSGSADKALPGLDKLPPTTPPRGGHPGLSRSRPGVETDRARKQQLITTVESDPDAVAQTLKQWIQE